QPGFGYPPLSHNGDRGHLNYFGSFFNAQPAKESQLDNLAFAFVKLGKTSKSIVKRNQFHRSFVTNRRRVFQLQMLSAAAPFGESMTSRVINQDVSHHLGGYGE